MEIAILILASIAVIGVIALLLVLIFKRTGTSDSGIDPQALKDLEKSQIVSSTEIKANIKSLSDDIETRTEARLKGQMVEIAKAMQTQSESDNQRMNAFQQTVNSNLNAQVQAINETIARRFGDITSKNMEQMNAMQKSMKDLMESDTKRLNDFQTTIGATVTAQINAMNLKLDESMKSINEKVNQTLSDGFKGTSESMVNLQKQLGMVQEAQKSIDGVQQEITSLKDVLSNNQTRGRYGEFQLELLLDNLFQGSKGTLYDTQYILQEARGEESQLKPDAVIFLDGETHHQMVCIDSKFSLTGYDRLFDRSAHLSEDEEKQARSAFKTATRQRIDETSKYIIQGKTISNAIMFVPNDGVFAYIHNEFPDLIDYAQKKNVVLVSPTILQPLLASFRVIQIDAKKSKSIAEINQHLNALGTEFKRFIPRWKSLNDGIQNLTKKSGSFDTTVQKIGQRFEKVQKIDFSDFESDEISSAKSIGMQDGDEDRESEEVE